jgi:hypothetical protein
MSAPEYGPLPSLTPRSVIEALAKARSSARTSAKSRSYCSLEQKPITRSTPARLYHERSKRMISPAVGKCAT